MIYEDERDGIESLALKYKVEAPLLSAFDLYGWKHTVWRIKDARISNLICDYLKEKSFVIADGHHRYGASLEYYIKNNGCAERKYRMMAFVNVRKNPVTLLKSKFGMSVLDIINIAKNGQILPQKSTNFYPKFLSGMLIYKF